MDRTESFVGRFESAIAEFAILNEAQQRESVDPQDLADRVTSRLDIRSDTVAQACERLAQDGHLAREGGRYRITQDGREDVRKLARILQSLPSAGGASESGAARSGPAGGTSASGGNLRTQGSDEPSGAVTREGGGGAGPSIHKPGAMASSEPEGRDVTTGDKRRGDQTTGR